MTLRCSMSALNRSHIVEWWGGEEARPTLADVQEQYLPSVLAQRVRHSIHCNAEWRADWVCPVVRCSWKRGRMVGRRNRSGSTRNRPVTGECISQLGKGLGTKLVQLWLSCCSMIRVSARSSGPVAEQLDVDATKKAGFERQGFVTTPDGPAVYMVSNRQAFEANTQCCPNPSIRGTSKGWRPWPPHQSTLKHHEGSGDRRSIDSTIRGSWRHRAPISNRRCWRTFVRLRVDGGWLKPHSDIDLLVTVTVRLDGNNAASFDQRPLETSASPGESEILRCRSHHCCARRHHSVALSS